LLFHLARVGDLLIEAHRDGAASKARAFEGILVAVSVGNQKLLDASDVVGIPVGLGRAVFKRRD
jgi:hypothetical protein